MDRIIIIVVMSLILAGCATTPIPVMVNETQTEIATTGATVSGDIATIKEITDVAKTTGDIPKASVPTVIKFVDKAYTDVNYLNELINKQTKNISKNDALIESLNAEVEKYKPYKWRFFIYLGLTITGAGIVLIWKLKNIIKKIA